MNEIDEMIRKYDYAKKILETEIDILVQEFSFKRNYNPVEHIKSRLKSKESIQKKLDKKGLEFTAYNMKRSIDDIVGIRIVCSFLTDVYDIVSMLSESKRFIIKERKDYIKNPKSTGYSSYHLIVLVPVFLQDNTEYITAEIQIRTVAMDFWASLDHKIKYKFEGQVPEDINQELYQYSMTMQELDKRMLGLNELMQKYKKDL